MQFKHHSNTHNHTYLPSEIFPDNETVERDDKTPSESFRNGQAIGELYSLPKGRGDDPLFLYHLKEAENRIKSIYSHLQNAEKLKETIILDGGWVHEYHVWHHTPLNELSFTFGLRILPGLMVAAELTNEWAMISDIVKWFTSEWLPKADGVASIMRMMDRVDSRTRPVANICLPMMDEFRVKLIDTVDYLRKKYPELPIRIGNDFM